MSDSTTQVVTRFAPSPTGQLHVGGARTALYAWAFARRHGGRFLLRLEDTDRKRSSEAAAEAILADLKWLGLDWDNPEIPRQSQRLELYNRYIDALIKSGDAYEADGAVRFRMGESRGDIVFDDAVYGRIQTPGKDLEDFVIRKADGFPTFHLAVVVDDALMEVTHVIRGQEHLSNTPKHAALCDALGFKRPTWAHLPSIMNPDGSKMSKRDKAKAARAAALDYLKRTGKTQTQWFTELLDEHDLIQRCFGGRKLERRELTELMAGFLDRLNEDAGPAKLIAFYLKIQLPEIEVMDFRLSGYLPWTLLNYLALLGWNPGKDIERFDRAFLVANFGLDRVNKANSRFDRAKLLEFNRQDIAAMPREDFKEALWHHPRTGHLLRGALTGRDDPRLEWLAAATQQRSRTIADAVYQNRFLFSDEFQLDPKAVEKVLLKGNKEGMRALERIQQELRQLPTSNFGEAAHACIVQLAEREGVNMGTYAQPIRVAVSGSTVTPPLDLTLNIIGKGSTLHRIDLCLVNLSR